MTYLEAIRILWTYTNKETYDPAKRKEALTLIKNDWPLLEKALESPEESAKRIESEMAKWPK